MQYKFDFFFKITKKIFFAYLILLSTFMLFRLSLLLQYGSFSELKNYKLDLINAFYVGIKFDTSVTTYGLLPVFLYGLLISLFTKKDINKTYKKYSKTVKIYLTIISIIFFIISLIDYFFYKYFQTHINPTIYGIKYDKTDAVLISMWTDYPVIKIFFLIVVIIIIYTKAYKIIFKPLEEKPLHFPKVLYNSITVFTILLLYFIGMRGSLGMFPLKLDHTTISTNTFVNELVLNGPFALKLARGLKKESQEVHTDFSKTLNKYDFKTKKSALSLFLDKSKLEDKSISEILTQTTNKNKFLEKNPPNVVFILLESFSNHYLDLHSKELNLLGELEKQLPYCYVFRNFLSARNGTIETLENIIVGTPISPISQSSFSDISFKSSVAKPFKENNYQTTFLTGGQLGWRNTGKFIKHQNFDNVQGFSFLKEKYTNPEYFSWGVHDEYLYKHIFDILNNTKKPQFIFTLTVSNHTPYNVPKHILIPKQKISKKISKKLISSNKIAIKNFVSYYYTIDQLGKFIKKIRNSPLHKNTIIVATGDHNERGMFKYNTGEEFLKRSVPLIIYIPEKYKPKNVINTNRFGSQKDIFPTIYNISLSNTNFIKTGNNLFSKTENYYFSQNDYTMAGNKIGVIIKNGKTNYYKWKDTVNYKKLISTTKEKTPELYKLKRKMEAYGASMMLNIQENIIEKINR